MTHIGDLPGSNVTPNGLLDPQKSLSSKNQKTRIMNAQITKPIYR